MPYVSDAQRKFFNANREELASQGVDVDEWNRSSKGLKLPKKKKKPAMKTAAANGLSPRTVKVAMDVLRTQARRQERKHANARIKVAGLMDSPKVQAAMSRLGNSISPAERGLLRLRQLLQSPRAQRFLMGAGTGAALGVTADALSSPEDGKHHYIRSALLGGGIGGGVTTNGYGLLDKKANAPIAATSASVAGSQVPSMAPRVQPEPPPAPPAKPAESNQQPQATAPGTQLSRPGHPSLRRFMQNHAAVMSGQANRSLVGSSFTPRTVSPSGNKLANAGVMPAGQPQPAPSPEMQALMQGQAPAPPKSPMQLLHELPGQLTSELQSRQQHLHAMLGDAQVPLADKLTALGKMLKGLPDPPKDPLAALSAGGMSQPMAPKVAGAMDTLADTGKTLVDGLRSRLADPKTRTQTAALLGAGLGGAASLTAEAAGKRSNKRYLNALLTGAGAGAMLGGGSGYISREMGRDGSNLLRGTERDPKVETAAKGLLGQISQNPGEAAKSLNKLTTSTTPTLGEYTRSMVGAATNYTPFAALTGGGLLASDVFRGIRGYANAIKFQNRSQLNTDPTLKTLPAPANWRQRIMRKIHNPNYQSSMLHRVAPDVRSQQAAEHLAVHGGMSKWKDRLLNLFDSRAAQDALLRDANQLPKALGHDTASLAADKASMTGAERAATSLEQRMARLKTLLPQRESQIKELERVAGETRQQAKEELKKATSTKPVFDPITGARTTYTPSVTQVDVDKANAAARTAREKLAKLRSKLIDNEGKVKSHRDTASRLKDKVEYGEALERALTPERRHSLIQALNSKADAAHPELTPIYDRKLHEAHRGRKLGPASLTHRVGRNAVGVAAGLDGLRMLAQYLTPTEE